MTSLSFERPTHRRDFLWQTGGGLGGIALASLLGQTGCCADVPAPRPEFNGGLHHKASVRRVMQLFMNGGVSQMDTFDYKPELDKRHGEKVDFGIQVGGDQRARRDHEIARSRSSSTANAAAGSAVSSRTLPVRR